MYACIVIALVEPLGADTVGFGGNIRQCRGVWSGGGLGTAT